MCKTTFYIRCDGQMVSFETGSINFKIQFNPGDFGITIKVSGNWHGHGKGNNNTLIKPAPK